VAHIRAAVQTFVSPVAMPTTLHENVRDENQALP
jgi:hypothetical protein